MTVGSTREVHGDGQDRGAGAQSERGRAGGQLGALAEEVDVDAAAADVAVGQQADDLVALERPQVARPASAPSGDHRHSQFGPQLGEPIEQLGRLDRLDHDRHGIAAGRPASAPPTPTRRGAAGRGSRRCPLRGRQRCARSRGPRSRRRRFVLTAMEAAGSRPSTGRTTRRRPARRHAVSIDDQVGLTRRRWRSIIARRWGLATFAPKPIGFARPLATTPGITRASSEPAR